MDEHIKFTMAILFMNITLFLVFPSNILGSQYDNYLFSKGSNNEYTISSSLNNSVASPANKASGIAKGSIGLTDVFTFIYDFIVLTLKIFFSSLILVYQLPDIWRLLIGIPIVIMYAFAIMRWFK